jgi:nitrile hydratase
MNGVHDMGGMTDFGPIPIERDEPTFHADWERRVFGMTRFTIDGRFNWDEFRSAIERLDPTVYLSVSYYDRWLSALERYVVEKGLLMESELKHASGGLAPVAGNPPHTSVPDAGDGTPSTANDAAALAPSFVPGDRVRVRNMNPHGHTRVPRYVRGRIGVIDRVLGAFIYPDRNSLGLGAVPQPVYAVRFEARVLWGDAVPAKDSVCVDLWEEYLEVQG